MTAQPRPQARPRQITITREKTRLTPLPGGRRTSAMKTLEIKSFANLVSSRSDSRFVLLPLVALCGILCSETHAGIVFSDGFQSGNLNNWARNGSGVLVPDPAGGSGLALTFSHVWYGNDIWSPTFSAATYLSFDYYGRTGAGVTGAILGVNPEYVASDFPYYDWASGKLTTLLIDDNSWHSYQFHLPAFNVIVMELWGSATSVPGNGFFRNIVVSTTPVPEPSTFIAGIGAVIGMLGLARWKNRE